MNYRHAFHAGNFADLAKHAILLDLLSATDGGAGPLTVIDTHAGAGLYDLSGPEALRTGEAAGGVARLMAAEDSPAEFLGLKAAVRRLNPSGNHRVYPGSPVLIAERLRQGDRLIACESRSDDHGALRLALRAWPLAEAVKTDGWSLAARRAPRSPSPLLVLIDPPYEAPDDAARAAELTRTVLAINRQAILAIWAPIKDLTSFDSMVGTLEDAARGRPILVAQVRLRALSDPMRLNGCAMVIINPPVGLERRAKAIVDWISANLGEGGEGQTTLGTGG